MSTPAPYTSWDPRQMGPVLSRALPAPWDAPGRVGLLLRVAVTSPPLTSLPAHAAPAPMVLLERAIHPDVAVRTEALGDSATPLTLLSQHPRAVVILGHGGPRAGDVQPSRPLAAKAHVDARTNRSCQALTAAQWEDLERALVTQGEALLQAGAWGLGLEVARGQLFHAALSPLTGDDATAAQCRKTVAAVLRAWRSHTPRVLLSLAVEDVAVGGLTATDGVALARLFADAGATLILVRTGAVAMPARLWPHPPRSPHEEGPSLHAAAWTRRALPAKVLVMAAGSFVEERTMAAAVDAGLLDGVVVEEPGAQPPA